MTMISMKIVNWDRYNPKEFKNNYPHWFRLNKDTLQSQSLFELSPEERWVWIGLLCIACEKKNEAFTAPKKWVAHRIGVTEKVLDTTLQKLVASGALEANLEPTSSKCRPTEHNKTEQNITEQDKILLPRTFENERLGQRRDLGFEIQGDVKEEHFKVWLATYQDEDWIKQELRKAVSWLVSNKHKAPKRNYPRFYNNWLSRGWENYRKGLASNQSKETDWGYVFGDKEKKGD